MAVETFHTLIAKNKRNSYLLIVCFMVFFIGLGLLIGYVWGHGEMVFAFIVAGIAGAVAFIMTLASYYGGSSALLGLRRAKQVTPEDQPQIFNVV